MAGFVVLPSRGAGNRFRLQFGLRKEIRRPVHESAGGDKELRPGSGRNGWNDSYYRLWRGSHRRARGGDSRKTAAGSGLWEHLRKVPARVEAEKGIGPPP